jgi:hypothetical protein
MAAGTGLEQIVSSPVWKLNCFLAKIDMTSRKWMLSHAVLLIRTLIEKTGIWQRLSGKYHANE